MIQRSCVRHADVDLLCFIIGITKSDTTRIGRQRAKLHYGMKLREKKLNGSNQRNRICKSCENRVLTESARVRFFTEGVNTSVRNTFIFFETRWV